eukprot:g2685.t1
MASSMQSSHVILAGDIGGTNSRFEVFAVSPIQNQIKGKPTPGSLLFSKKYQNEKFGSFLEVIEKFLEEAGCALPAVACLAVAGPVSDNRAVFTNRGWVVDGHILQEETGMSRVVLINDFAGVAYGLLTLSDSDCMTLQDVPAQEGGPIACVGAGTGLGMCYLTSLDGNYKAFTSEGGHAEFAPRTELEIDLWRFLKDKFGQKYRVSHERVISGLGLFNIYDFLRQYKGSNKDESLRANADIDGQLERTNSSLGSLRGNTSIDKIHSSLALTKPLDINVKPGPSAAEGGDDGESASGSVLGRVNTVRDAHMINFASNVDAELEKEINEAGDMKAAIIAQNAEKDLLCCRAMQVMISAYGSVAGSAALQWLPTGGLYIAGGLAPKNWKWFTKRPQEINPALAPNNEAIFMQSFKDKGRMSFKVLEVPVKLVLNEDVGRKGAHYISFQLYKEHLHELAIGACHLLACIRTSEHRYIS